MQVADGLTLNPYDAVRKRLRFFDDDTQRVAAIAALIADHYIGEHVGRSALWTFSSFHSGLRGMRAESEDNYVIPKR
jgi:hypothetical protein